MSIVINMSEDANQERNQTFVDFDADWRTELKNVTEIYSSLNYVNFTSLPDVNTTEEIDSFYFYETEQFTVLWLLFAVIVAGNSAVLAGLLLGKRRKSRMDFFIKQLAFADLLVGLISVLTDIVWRATVTWYAGNIACKLIRFMQALVTYSSTYVLVALSIDRYDAITRPMNFSGSWWRARALVITAWALSALFSAPIIFLYEETRIQGTTQCWIDLGSPIQWKIYMTLVSISLFIAPTLIIGGCYTVIVITIWSQGSALRQGPTRDTRRASSRGLIPRAKIKTVKMTFVIVFVFILCWSPYIVFDLLQVYGHVPKTQTNIAVATFIQSLTPLNSAANPIIYCLFSTSFCKTIRNMQATSWISGWCPSCFGGGPTNSSRRATVTTSLTAQSSRRNGHFTMLHSTSRKRVMVSLV
ncbi:cardioacceleratory peptide receptor-like isoform X2 [Pseudomyrmex gracilis]|uniref:cardioacceleratory peptide receptor-like isoform X2 n=1 Tax=Pseudomyrmex gracilis TaxID=219809 RepID=UPI000995C75D|nr:cardioacceleratory peptide receptor-like isoform X2 [Pseudomyrmex gracilis]XP_020291902.1 cardioacceleratory peptide receptor-like isoform X2 [Pseudomyrmex gracilis]XP_020291903.1 cardioacceleratory peptide receptor-like isoform X2 [Pseudomyrmex gracilis]XP_020291904.1 cardioacceleratory peptide receptor-like isoform X2 [Pseudomyrmex gracilis]XP_020291905.1 cardioacceleratory peptide receptor-like isoform X2 [Pseudomyrmex gracilis]XP_020291906.1 cardioacceleratory peptide receptor-like isof